MSSTRCTSFSSSLKITRSGFFIVGMGKNLSQPFKSAATSHVTVLWLTMVLFAFFLSGTLPACGTKSILPIPCFSGLGAYRGSPTRMVYLYYISCLRYTILVGNPRYFPSSTCFFTISVSTLSTSLCLQVYLFRARWQFERICFMVPSLPHLHLSTSWTFHLTRFTGEGRTS